MTPNVESLKKQRFGIPSELKIKGIVIKLLPLSSDWPQVDKVNYSKETDKFIITFSLNNKSGEIKENRIDDFVSVHTDSNGLIAGVEIRNVFATRIENVELQIHKSFDAYKDQLKRKIEESGFPEIYENIGRFDRTDRTLSFVGDVATDMRKQFTVQNS